jgi:hypothetical protein
MEDFCPALPNLKATLQAKIRAGRQQVHSRRISGARTENMPLREAYDVCAQL